MGWFDLVRPGSAQRVQPVEHHVLQHEQDGGPA